MTLVLPGIIILGIRTRAIRGLLPPLKDQLATYAVVAVCYATIAAPVFHFKGGLALPGWLWSLSLNALAPAVVGIALAYVHQFGIVYWIARLGRLKLVHHVPTAWDYTFENVAAGSHVLIRMKDGKEIPGQLAEGSFVSSSSTERDILLSTVWEIDAAGVWSEVDPKRSMLICAGDIRWIEIF